MPSALQLFFQFDFAAFREGDGGAAHTGLDDCCPLDFIPQILARQDKGQGVAQAF